MASVEEKVHINATAEEVYQVLMGFQSYPDWNPMVVKIEGDPSPSSTIAAHIKIGNRSPQTITPVVLKNEPNKEFRWIGKLFLPFIFRGEHYFIIEPEADGGCTFIHGEIFSGFLAPLMSIIFGDDVPKAFASFNLAIKAKVEENISKGQSS